jgi:sigma-B regulation protein RsbU (phosphoserine phosphatase)
MPNLFLTKTPDGSASGEKYPLSPKEPNTIGSSPEKCRIVLASHAVSREHAKIIPINGQFYLEDLGSRNATFLNSKKVEGRVSTPLKDGDNIKICDFLFSYQDENAKPKLDLALGKTTPPEEEEEAANTTVEATFHRVPPQQFLDTQPNEKLRAILDISSALSKTLNVESLLPQIADELFKVFKQADRCFVIQVNEENRLIPVVQRFRRPAPGGERFSRTIVRKCLDTLQSYLSEDASSDQTVGLAQSIAEFKIRSVMCVPLATQDGTPLGVIQLDSQDRTKKFSQDDLKMLICVASQASISLENADLHGRLLKQQKVEEENKAAKKVQLGFLPQQFPMLPGYEFFAHYMPARTVGGDYYDFIPLPDGRQGVLLGDVSGKGVPAALLMARLSGEARVSMLTQANVASAITHLNEQLMQANLEDRYVTLSAAVIDPKTHRVDIVSAGHLSPFVFRHATKKLEKIFEKDTGDFPVGWVPGHQYTSYSVELNPGDSMFVYTDGIEDAQPTSGDRFLEDGVVRTVNAMMAPNKALHAREIGDRLIKAVQLHVGNHPQFDDIAIVCFGRLSGNDPTTTTKEEKAAV